LAVKLEERKMSTLRNIDPRVWKKGGGLIEGLPKFNDKKNNE